MLIERPKQKIVIRYGRNKAGELFRAYFLLTEIDGRVFAKIVKVERIQERLKIKDLRFKHKTQCLPIFCKKSALPEVALKEYRPKVSPYFSQFEFFSSQMIRAPALS